VIPGSGRVANEADVVEYRDMLKIIHDRVRDAVHKNQTLEQVMAAKPSRDYDVEYGDGTALVASIYRSLNAKK